MSELERIIAPPRVFLDTNHLIGIANVRRGRGSHNAQSYAKISAWLESGTCTLVYAKASIMEWLGGNATTKSADELAKVVDSAAVSLELEMDCLVYAAEVLAECRRIEPSLRIPELVILLPKGHDQPPLLVLGRTVSEFRQMYPAGYVFPDAVPRRSARMQVRDFKHFLERQRDVAGAYRGWFNEAQLKSQECLVSARGRGYARNSKLEWIRRCLRVVPILRA